MTVEEFAQVVTPETEDYELVKAKRVRLERGAVVEAEIRSNVEMAVKAYFREHRIGWAYREVDCRLSDTTVRRPDVSIFLHERLRLIDRHRAPIAFAPDIAVQVLCPAELFAEAQRKTRDYLAAGSREVWQVDHRNGLVTAWYGSDARKFQGDGRVETPWLPGFSVAVSALLSENYL